MSTTTSLPTFLGPATPPYCKGCGHTTVTRKLNEAMVRLGLEPSQIVLTSDIGCGGLRGKHRQILLNCLKFSDWLAELPTIVRIGDSHFDKERKTPGDLGAAGHCTEHPNVCRRAILRPRRGQHRMVGESQAVAPFASQIGSRQNRRARDRSGHHRNRSVALHREDDSLRNPAPRRPRQRSRQAPLAVTLCQNYIGTGAGYCQRPRRHGKATLCQKPARAKRFRQGCGNPVSSRRAHNKVGIVPCASIPAQTLGNQRAGKPVLFDFIPHQ